MLAVPALPLERCQKGILEWDLVAYSSPQEWDDGGRSGTPALGSPPRPVSQQLICTNCARVHCRSESAFEKGNVDVFRVRTNNVGLIYKVR